MADERKVAFICSKGNLDMAYPALVMGWAALGNGIDVTIFFTFWGMDMITKDRVDHLEIPPVGNASMKMNMMGVPGYVGIPQFMGAIPGMTPFATALMNKKMKEAETPRGMPRIPSVVKNMCATIRSMEYPRWARNPGK